MASLEQILNYIYILDLKDALRATFFLSSQFNARRNSVEKDTISVDTELKFELSPKKKKQIPHAIYIELPSSLSVRK